MSTTSYTEREKAMIDLTKTNLTNASARARNYRNFVRRVSAMTYAVTSRKSNRIHTVRLSVVNGHRFAACDCPASEKNYPCHAIPSAIWLHNALRLQRERLVLMSVRALLVDQIRIEAERMAAAGWLDVNAS